VSTRISRGGVTARGVETETDRRSMRSVSSERRGQRMFGEVPSDARWSRRRFADEPSGRACFCTLRR
jgi:hypothetical protein